MFVYIICFHTIYVSIHHMFINNICLCKTYVYDNICLYITYVCIQHMFAYNISFHTTYIWIQQWLSTTCLYSINIWRQYMFVFTKWLYTLYVCILHVCLQHMFVYNIRLHTTYLSIQHIFEFNKCFYQHVYIQ